MRRGVIALVCALTAVALALPTSSQAGSGLRFFHTADGNIDCMMFKGVKKKRHKHPRLPGAVRCDVKNHTWVAPPKPRWCDVDWGFGVQVGEKRAGSYLCAGDTVALPGSPLLATGTAMTLGRFTCTSPADGTVHCQNNRNGHGFEVSAASVSLF
jgi:Family of unknown function (DUF6636)